MKSTLKDAVLKISSVEVELICFSFANEHSSLVFFYISGEFVLSKQYQSMNTT